MSIREWWQRVSRESPVVRQPDSVFADEGPLSTLFIVKDIPKSKSDMERTSFIGGRPLVSPEFVWPKRHPTRSEKENGRESDIPLHFVCQFDCSHVSKIAAELPLPKQGILYFFYGLETEAIVDEGEPPFWRVIYEANVLGRLKRADLPKGLKNIELGSELQTDQKGNCRRYKELGYIPVSFVTGETSQYEEVTHTEERSYRERRRLAKEQYLGPVPPSPEVEISRFNISARNAKTWLIEELRVVPARIEVMTEQLAEFDAGKRKDHQAKGFFNELKSKRRKNGQSDIPDEEIWLELVRGWQRLLPRFKAQLPKVMKLNEELSKLNDNDFLPQHVKLLFEEHKAFSDEVSVYPNSFDSEDARRSRQFLLRHNCVEDSGLDDLELAFEEHERKKIEDNENQLLGYADEVQAASKKEAFAYARSLGWTESDQTEADLTLLLQLDSCRAGSGMMWGDMGKAYFYIFKDDLANHRFDRVSHVMHGH
jgi:uncharacterized protein YwqG